MFCVLGCDCQTVVILVKNDISSSALGVYQKSDEINGQPTWRSDSMGIWISPHGYYEQNYWFVGFLNFLGERNGVVLATSAFQNGLNCPYDFPSNHWKYASDGDWAWANANDMTIGCVQGT